MWRLLAALVAFGFLIALLLTSLDITQRWLLTGVIWSTAVATWLRK